jgi:hypothetical protein
LWLLQIQPLPITLPQELPTLPVALSKQKSQSPLLQLFQTERWGGKRCSVAGKSESQSRRVAESQAGGRRVGGGGGSLSSGGLRSFGLLHCGARSSHFGARRAAPGTGIMANERDGQHWGRLQLLGSNVEVDLVSEWSSDSRSWSKKGKGF